MKIYFSASITGGREHAGTYPAIVAALQVHGEVLTEIFAAQELTNQGTQSLTPKEIHDRDMKWLLAADVVVADITVPSLGVGYEIGRAVENGKRVLCLYQPHEGKRVSSMITGSNRVATRSYTNTQEAKIHIDSFFADKQRKKILTLVLVQQSGKILLGQKKRGFGTGKWNGFGGKVEANETIEEGARRELLEEANLGTVAVERRGRITFYFRDDPVALEVYIFRVKSFTGTPRESDEMIPRWFSEKDIPYDTMWADDRLWLPLFLENKRFEGEFWFNDEHTIERHDLREV